MTAIEKLREKLDELGIEWDVSRQSEFTNHSVIYESNGIKWIVFESPYSRTFILSSYKDDLSLEQVIHATIGDEPTSTCGDERVDELLPCPFCGGESLTISVDGGITPVYMDLDTQEKIWAENKYVATCTVICDSCCASVQGYYASSEDDDLISARATIDCFKKWNRRAGK